MSKTIGLLAAPGVAGACGLPDRLDAGTRE